MPGVIAMISTFWFMIGGVIDLRRMFRDLAARQDNPLDDGRVEGHVSLADRKAFKQSDRRQQADAGEIGTESDR